MKNFLTGLVSWVVAGLVGGIMAAVVLYFLLWAMLEWYF